MTKKLLILAILLSVSLPAFAQEVDTAWVRTYNGPGDTADYAWALAIDGSGNVYVTGRSNGGSGTWDDYATIKYYPNGDTAWVRRYDGPANFRDWAFDMAVDDSGNAYVTGRSAGSGGRDDYATVKYCPNGDTAWVRRYNGPEDKSDVARAIAVDDSGNVYVTGASHSSGSEEDYLTIKYYPNGDTAWVRSYNGPGDSIDYTNDIAVDDSGNVYVTGTSYGSGTERDYATIKYYPNGDTAWVRRYNGSGDSIDIAYAIAVDDLDNVYVTGYSYGSGTNRDYATIKYAPDGTELWTQTYNWSGDSPDVARALALDDSGNVYVTGSSGTIKYDAGGNELWIGSWGGVDIALDTSNNIYVTGVNLTYVTLKYCPNGDTAWVTAYGNLSLDAANAIAVDGSGNVYVTGYSFGSGTYYDYATIKYVQYEERVEICKAFLTPKKLNVKRNAEHTFKIHLRPCEPMDVSRGDSAEVYVDVDASCTFDADELYPAVVNSPSMVVKVYCPDLVDNDPKVVIYSVNNIPISDTLGNDIVLYLDTFTPKGKGPKSLATVSPDQLTLSQNYPNPFNPTCEIAYTIPTDCQVTLVIYNILGQKVKVLVDEYQDAGNKSVKWDGRDDQGQEVTSGVYFYRIQAGDFEDTKKMILVK